MEQALRTANMCAALVVHADADQLQRMVAQLGAAHIAVVGVTSYEAARAQLMRQQWDVLVAPIRLGAFNGLQIARRARDMYPAMTIVLNGRGPDPEVEHEALALNARYLSDGRPDEQASCVIEACAAFGRGPGAGPPDATGTAFT
jgi:CheY-like chemotaxis protein